MASSDVDIASQALVLLGAGDIGSFLDETDKARTAAQLYPDLRDALIAEYPWRFCMVKSDQLAKLTAAPSNEWANAFPLPPDMIGTTFALFNSAATGSKPIQRWEQFGNSIYTDETIVFIDYKQRPLENAWPEYFVRLMVLECAWNFAEGVTDDSSKKTEWFTACRGTPGEDGKGGYWRTATLIDAQGSPSQSVPEYDLIAHRTG